MPPTAPAPWISSLWEAKLNWISNGTNWAIRFFIVIAMFIALIILICWPKVVDVGRFYWPPRSHLIIITIYFAIPFIWISMNIQMRYSKLVPN